MNRSRPSQVGAPATVPMAPLRLDSNLRLTLKQHTSPVVPAPPPDSGPTSLPDPVFPQHPELLDENYKAAVDPYGSPDRRRYPAPLVYKAMRGWLFPYIRSRVEPGPFHPIVAYLFTEWKCNIDCHYCWAFDNRIKGMTEETAKRAVDWLHDTGCRVLAFMGGEVLLRPNFVHKVAYYAAKKGFWIYVPTNGRLMRPDVIDRLADAGIATVNLAVDTVDEKPGLPKALAPIRSYYEYLIKKQYRYGYSVFFNINICRTNLDDVKQLTEIARADRIATDYHINESPMMEQPHFKHLDENSTFITEQDWPRVDAVVDWLIEKGKSGYKMVNSAARLNDMKTFMRGQMQPWNCRAGQNSLIIRTDGTLAPCFPMYTATVDWGRVGDQKFQPRELDKMKVSCQRSCFSTLNHNLGYCYNDTRVIRWVLRQAARGFQGVTGSFE
jgi:MoaA/NifB/PqqE/SkfB family radical SAM enzyme